MGYLAVYRGSFPRPGKEILLAQGGDYCVYVHPGPFTISYPSGSPDPSTKVSTMNIAHQTRDFAEGSYIVVQVGQSQGTGTTNSNGWADATSKFSEAVVALDIDFPGIVGEKLYEGPVNTKATPFFLTWEEGYRFHRRPSYDPTSVSGALQSRLDHFQTLSRQDLSRLVLAARWFRRANDSTNSIDRILFYYTVLEIYPTLGDADVPNRVCDFLVDRLYPTLSRSEVKTKLNLGRICSFRAEIVHRGKATVDLKDVQLVDEYIETLRALTRTSLRLLARLGAAVCTDTSVAGCHQRKRSVASPRNVVRNAFEQVQERLSERKGRWLESAARRPNTTASRLPS